MADASVIFSLFFGFQTYFFSSPTTSGNFFYLFFLLNFNLFYLFKLKILFLL